MTRLSTTELYRTGIDEMLRRQSDLLKTQLQLSSGRKILKPSDDPSGSIQALEFRDAVATTEQYLRNITLAERRLELEESVLTHVAGNIQRAHELGVQAANGSQSAQTRENSATEMRQLFDELLQLANTVDANGEYIFGGYQSLSEPFTATGLSVSYNNDDNVRKAQISAVRQMAIGHSGQEVFVDFNIFGVYENYITALEADDVPGIQQAIGDLLDGLNHMSDKRATIGGRLRTLETQRVGHESAIMQYKTTLSSIEDLDYASAISGFQLQMTGLEAAQQSYLMVQRLSLFDYMR